MNGMCSRFGFCQPDRSWEHFNNHMREFRYESPRRVIPTLVDEYDITANNRQREFPMVFRFAQPRPRQKGWWFWLAQAASLFSWARKRVIIIGTYIQWARDCTTNTIWCSMYHHSIRQQLKTEPAAFNVELVAEMVDRDPQRLMPSTYLDELELYIPQPALDIAFSHRETSK